MKALTEVRLALVEALAGAGYNVSPGGDLVPNGATIGGFVCNYHPTVAGANGSHMAVAGCEVRVATDRADEWSAQERMDEAMTALWQVLEQADGPWHSAFVSTARPDAPLTVGESTYASLAFVMEFYV